MKILHVITSLLPGGAEKLLVDLLPRFKARGAEAEVAVFNAVETPLVRSLLADGILMHRFAPGGANVYSPKNLWRLAQLIHSGDYDIVHSHNTAAQFFTAMAPKPQGTVYVTTEHNTYNRRRSNHILRGADKAMYSRYDKIVCISDLTCDALCNHVGTSLREKCVVIPNGIDINKYSRPIASPPASGEVIITMVAGFRKQKDQDTLIRAMGALPESYRLRLVGDGERRQALERLAHSEGVADRVEFVGESHNVGAILSESHVQVMSSHYEGLSLSSIEAMASGRPVIASDVPGLREAVSGAGILFPEGDHHALTDAILRVSTAAELYRSVAHKCTERAALYDIDLTASRYLSLYRSLLP